MQGMLIVTKTNAQKSKRDVDEKIIQLYQSEWDRLISINDRHDVISIIE